MFPLLKTQEKENMCSSSHVKIRNKERINTKSIYYAIDICTLGCRYRKLGGDVSYCSLEESTMRKGKKRKGSRQQRRLKEHERNVIRKHRKRRICYLSIP